MTSKTPPAQLDREIQEALGDPKTWGRTDAIPTATVSDFSVRIGGLGYRVTTSKDFDRGGWRSRLIAEGIGMIMDENGASPSDALTRLVRSLDSGDATDRKLAHEIARRAWFPLESSSTKAPVAFSAPKPTLTVRQVNAIVRAADGRNVYLIRRRLDEETVQRVTRARTKGREMEVRALSTGNWLPVLPERGDRLEVR
jgi:hypothetical protein